MSSDLRITVLGCGSSGGVPRFGGKEGAGEWGACDPEEPKNRRTRCSILVQKEHPEFGFQHDKVTSVLVDTSPDMRAQLLAARCSRLDAVLFTHDHADQSHGIDDLRVFALHMRKRIPVYIDCETSGVLLDRFKYCFEQAPGSPYPAILDYKAMPECGEEFTVSGPSGEIPVIPFLQYHGSVNSLGFRFGDAAYSSDVVGLPQDSFDILSGVNIWVVDALQYEPHGTHAHLDLTLEWIERVRPRYAMLTNLHIHMDYQTLKSFLPNGVEPAYDGLIIKAQTQ
ncbi:MBL fold metallo-hydrolase [Hyphococcus flavus]|uniref:MBL fold metallo-hydrolase n=1 Tax=Hyphococcus flavus TaxID=1866326 RepID=A0AAE9ZEC8_9PROT|nr:MBL fold metallo-hydrolase [Hyphococcus flavus]WDI31052.1 MBL fold metallo-hydrolase [Hyphococcus flavus]